MSQPSRPPRTPKLCLHKRSGRAYATFDGHQVQFGTWGDPATQDAFATYVARWIANGRRPFDAAEEGIPRTVADLAARFLLTLEAERDTKWMQNNFDRFRHACRAVVDLFGPEPAAQFGPKALKLVRQKLIDGGRHCRKQINARVQTIRRMFEWAVAEELVPPSLGHALRAVAHLQRGHANTHEGRTVGPVQEDVMRETLDHLSPTIAGIVELLWTTGARPKELLALCPRDIDKSDPSCWSARLSEHKTARKGRLREVLFGPAAQEVLRRFLNRVPLPPDDLPVFSPIRTMQDLSVQRRSERKTPLWPSHAVRQERLAAEREARDLGDAYTSSGLRKAVQRGVRRANAARKLQGLQPLPMWTPYMLRHAAATRIRKTHGLEAVRVVLGHASVTMSEHYAEVDIEQARRVVRDL